MDAAYYEFPTHDHVDALVVQDPADFYFAFKVTGEITLKKYPNLPRFGDRAGRANENVLNADLFASAFLRPCAEFRPNVGLTMFKFP